MPTTRTVQRTYLILTLGNTLAASFIWGINTIFLLDAGLSNLEAFAANAFFTAGMVIFEVPTGIVADTIGRRASYLWGTVTLTLATLLYVWLWDVRAAFWLWALASLGLGLGFTFFSGAVEAWLVDALHATGFTGELETVFGRGQIVGGAAMLTGSLLGGVLAKQISLGFPFVLRAAVLAVMFVVAWVLMRDIGFTPERRGGPLTEMRAIARASIENGWRVPPVKWLMVQGLVTGGVGIYGFYALQPYLLELYGDPHAYVIAGLSAAIVAGAQILGGISAPRIRARFKRRTSALLLVALLSALTLLALGLLEHFWAAIAIAVVWALLFAATVPIRQAYLNALIPSRERATILSFDSLTTSTGGVWAQPVLGRAADAWGYPASYLISSAITLAGIPFLARSRKTSGD
ncbi:MFS transporter [Solirubrobacter soli]|uniref:MFS transporter n=1 Tax=Solirubrobacter soli TaxID=363832 RepID=UPI000407F1FA|nr:MFS transporter [Solirubrobacter soli]